MRRWCKAASSTILAGFLLLTACAAPPPEAQKNSAAKEESMVEDGQTLTVIEPDNSVSDAATKPSAEDGQKKYQIQTRLTDFRLLSDSQGLAWGSTNHELRLYMTEDHGKTWTNISPSASIQFAESPKFGKNLFFIDNKYGWIVRGSLGSGEAIVLRTDNGGLTWKMASLPKADQVVSFYFLNEKQGWILTMGNEPGNSGAKSIYATSNGGATWDNIMSTPIMPTGIRTAEHILPKTGYPAGMSFTDGQHGYITMIEAGLPVLYATVDGGVRWAKKPFLDTSKFKTCSRFTVGAPDFFANGGKEGWISVGCGREEAVKFNGYFTGDSGNTWTLENFAMPWESGSGENQSTTFMNSREGWSVQQSSVYHTLDGGATWTILPENSKLQQVIGEYPEVVKIQFYSPEVGWMLVAKADKKRSLLMQTEDGGVSWRVL
ncbi:WD40/YVTN/BNR-like repeat-containing protein [Paenibacillus sp. DYY-L-2]|uniref:WD40/YVTN/BNR-like repeat-containing protein n=1 Tax=Paenibacillus sp. DYY-L-2 TaxID=3447013 RepID=UPI003F4F5643